MRVRAIFRPCRATKTCYFLACAQRTVAGPAASGRLGLLIPLPEQAAKLSAKWERAGLSIQTEALRPSAGLDEARAAAARLAAGKPDLVVMDCMGYKPDMKAAVQSAVPVPTLLAITATGRVLAEMLE